MGKLVIAIILLGLTACTDPSGAVKAAEDAGFTDIQIEGYAFWGCGEHDAFHTKFTAKNTKGKIVNGIVCSGWFKGSTIRFF